MWEIVRSELIMAAMAEITPDASSRTKFIFNFGTLKFELD
jgi:hypothetical protein